MLLLLLSAVFSQRAVADALGGPLTFGPDVDWVVVTGDVTSTRPPDGQWLRIRRRTDGSVSFVDLAERRVVAECEAQIQPLQTSFDVGDVDGDGASEWVLRSPKCRWGAWSLASSQCLWELGEPERLGFVRAAIDDIDCDGVRDLVGWSWRPLEAGAAELSSDAVELAVWSGASGRRLLHRRLPADVDTACEITPVADLDDDGVGDLMVSGSNMRPLIGATSDLVVLSGSSLLEITRVSVVGTAAGRGQALLDGSITSGSGLSRPSERVTVILRERDGSGEARATVLAVDLRCGLVRWAFPCQRVDPDLSVTIASGSDVDDDGWDDLLVREHTGRIDGVTALVDGRLTVISGRDGRELRAHARPAGEAGLFPARAAFIGDCDRDGVDDYLVVEALGFFDSPECPERGFVFSGRTGDEILRMP